MRRHPLGLGPEAFALERPLLRSAILAALLASIPGCSDDLGVGGRPLPDQDERGANTFVDEGETPPPEAPPDDPDIDSVAEVPDLDAIPVAQSPVLQGLAESDRVRREQEEGARKHTEQLKDQWRREALEPLKELWRLGAYEELYRPGQGELRGRDNDRFHERREEVERAWGERMRRWTEEQAGVARQQQQEQRQMEQQIRMQQQQGVAPR